MRYRESYFQSPEKIKLKLDNAFLQFVSDRIKEVLAQASANDVVAILGTGSLFGFVRLSDVIKQVERDIQGRLVVFFPGQKDGNNYRLLDARDGWNYMAVGINRHPTGAVA